ncbi:MAG: class I SAM-dependent methyltransferase [Bacteroidota bacterium]
MSSDIYNDNTYLNNNPDWHQEDSPFKVGKILQLLSRNNIPLKTICEIGCGSGEVVVQLASKLNPSIQYTGVDISEAAIAIAKKKETNNIHFQQTDITQSNNNIPYDLLLVIDVIEHIENYFEFLEKINNKGKYTLFHIPLDMCLWSLFREKMLIESKERVGHIHNFTEDFIISILQDKGYKIIDKIYTEPLLKERKLKRTIIHSIRHLLFSINKRFCTKTIGGYSVMILTENSAN